MALSEKDIVKIKRACSSPSGVITKAAKFHMKPLNGLDILICGNCLHVFHLLADLQKHKQSDACCKPDVDPSNFNPTADIWAFMLWKNSPDNKKKKVKNVGNNAAMWRKWLELTPDMRRAWHIAGNILFDMNSIHRSEDDEENYQQFESKFSEKINELDLLSHHSEEESETPEKPKLLIEKQTKAHKRKQSLAAKSGSDKPKNLIHSIIEKKFDTKMKRFLYNVRWESYPHDFYTWETEDNLENWRDLVMQFEIQYSSPGRPCRTSKSRAMDRVKQWTNSTSSGGEDNSNATTKRSESEDEEEMDLELSDDEDFIPEEDPLGNFEDVNESSSSENLGDEEIQDEEFTVKQRGRKRKAPLKADSKKQKTAVSKKTEDRIFHLCNCNGIVRVNAKSVPKLKSGVFVADTNSSLTTLATNLRKTKSVDEQPGLVIITNDILRNKPGIRNRKGFKIQNETLATEMQLSKCSEAIELDEDDDDEEEEVEEEEEDSSEEPLVAVRRAPQVKSVGQIRSIKVPATVNNIPTQKMIQTVTNKKSALSTLMTNTPLTKPKSSVLALESKSRTFPSLQQSNVTADIQNSPQHIVMPQGVDPGAVEVPPGMQLMVSDTGEYYLLPQQPAGSTVALSQDPDSGVVQVVAIPENKTAPNQLRGNIKKSAPSPQLTMAPSGSSQDGSIINTGLGEQGLMLVMTQSGELVLVSSDQVQNPLNEGAVQVT